MLSNHFKIRFKVLLGSALSNSFLPDDACVTKSATKPAVKSAAKPSLLPSSSKALVPQTTASTQPVHPVSLVRATKTSASRLRQAPEFSLKFLNKLRAMTARSDSSDSELNDDDSDYPLRIEIAKKKNPRGLSFFVCLNLWTSSLWAYPGICLLNIIVYHP